MKREGKHLSLSTANAPQSAHEHHMSDKLQFVEGFGGGFCCDNDKLKFIGH